MRARRGLLALAILLAAPSALALDLDLRWQAPAACPTAAEIEADVSHIVGTSPHAQRHVSVDATVRQDRAWTLRLHVRSGSDEGDRTLEGASCQEVAKAAVLVIALTIDPEILSAPPPIPTPSPVAARPVAPQPQQASPTAQPPARRPRALRGVLQTTGGIAVRTLPGAAFVGTVSAGVRLGRAAARAGISLLPDSSETIDPKLGAGGTFWLLALHGRACAEPIVAQRFELWGCLGIELDRTAATGYGVTTPTSVDRVRGTLIVEPVEPAVALTSWLKLILPVELTIPLHQTNYDLKGVGQVFQPPQLGLRVGIGGEISF